MPRGEAGFIKQVNCVFVGIEMMFQKGRESEMIECLYDQWENIVSSMLVADRKRKRKRKKDIRREKCTQWNDSIHLFEYLEKEYYTES